MGPNCRHNPGPARAAAGICPRDGLCSDWLWSHMAMVGNASGMRKSCIHTFINSIFVVQTNPMLHTLKPRSSHVENLRSVWAWSAEIFEEHTHACTHVHTHACACTDTHRFLVFIERYFSLPSLLSGIDSHLNQLFYLLLLQWILRSPERLTQKSYCHDSEDNTTL